MTNGNGIGRSAEQHEAERPAQSMAHADSHGQVQVLKIEADGLKNFSWMFPAAIIMAILLGVNSVGFLVLYNRYQDLDMWAALMYSHAVKADAEIEVLGGKRLPPIPPKP